MFQTFDVQSDPEQGPPRLKALRAQMARTGVDGFLVPRADAHQGEYVAPRDARLGWLTGFTGSAGFCAVLADIAGVFIDGRYRLQVLDQVASDFTPVHWPEVQLADWLIDQMPNGGIVGFDPWLHTVDEINALRDAIAPDITLQACDNLVDMIWDDQPAAPSAPFTAYPDALAGETSLEKRQRLTAAQDAGETIITLPDSIAWLLNIRGTDIARNPVPHAFAVLHHDGTVDLFASAGKADALTDHLGPDVRLRSDDLIVALGGLTGPVRLDPKSCPVKIVQAVTADIVHAPDPCILPKAIKNATEVAGARDAHLRDGAAMVRFLAWLDATAPQGGLTEIDVVKQLETFRRDTNQLRDISFETISGAGPNGAIVHYRVSEAVDSGGQYIDGTTDITRTIAIGAPQGDTAACYTRVLQGMMAISMTRFPKGTKDRKGFPAAPRRC